MTVRVRFAPSPTGFLHMGGVRTALFNWLFARHHGGKFLLRIEDTDRERSKDEYVDVILDAMAWLGMRHDEDIVYQSKRMDAHVALAQRLLDEGKAYKCFCTPEELTAMREKATQEKGRIMYDGTWRDRTDHPTDGRPYTVRFKMRQGSETTLDDMVLGPVTKGDVELDDFIIVRSDGTPTYNFVVVCDDAHMEVTHVIRGQDHTDNTFKQIHLYHALGLPLPRFAHLPLIKGLSKRKGSTSVQVYRDQGYVQEAVLNYIARLGWSHGDQEIFSIEELVEKFDLDGVNKAPGTYDEQKMAWVNLQWMKLLSVETLEERVLPLLATRGITPERDDRFRELVTLLQPRANDLLQLADEAVFPYRAPTEYAPKAVKKWMKAGSRAAYIDLMGRLAALESFDRATIEQTFADICEAHELKMGKIAQPVRVAMTGTSVSPSMFESVEAVGQAEIVDRMKAALHLFPEPEA